MMPDPIDFQNCSETIRADDLAARLGSKCLPGLDVDRVLDELDRPVAEQELTPPGCRLLGGMVARLTMKNPQDRVFGPVMCWKTCWPFTHGAPMNTGAWLARLVMSRAWHCDTASAIVSGIVRGKKTSAIGSTTPLLWMSRIRSLKNPVLLRPSVMAAN